MNEISKLIEAYNRLWKNVEMMRQDVINILENDFGMEPFANGDLRDDIVYNSYFKGKMIIYIIIDLSAEIPFLQIFKIDVLDTKKISQKNI
jgi:alpha-N-acetylglucosamine transferase